MTFLSDFKSDLLATSAKLNKELFSLYPEEFYDSLHEELDSEASCMASFYMQTAGISEEFVEVITSNPEHMDSEITKIVRDKVKHVYTQFANTNGFNKQELFNHITAIKKVNAVTLVDQLHSTLYPYTHRYIWNKNKQELAKKYNLTLIENFDKKEFEKFKHDSCHRYGLLGVKAALSGNLEVDEDNISDDEAELASKDEYKDVYDDYYEAEWEEEGINIIHHYIRIKNKEEK